MSQQSSMGRLIERREQLLLSLKHLTNSILREKSSSKPIDGLLRQLKPLAQKLQKLSVLCVRSIVSWTLKEPPTDFNDRELYVWKGEEYLCKMWYDTNFVFDELGLDAKRLANFSSNNPLMLQIDADPVKSLTSPEYVAMMIVTDASLSRLNSVKSEDMTFDNLAANKRGRQSLRLVENSQLDTTVSNTGHGMSPSHHHHHHHQQPEEFGKLLLHRPMMSSRASQVIIEKLTEPPILAGASSTRFTVIRKLGEGAFGTVYLANDNRLARQVAVKEMKQPEENQRKETLNDNENDDKTLITIATLRDVEFSMKYSHANIVQAYGWYQPVARNESAYLIMECMDCCLLDVIDQRKVTARKECKPVFSPDECRDMTRQILSATEYIHSKIGFVHRDIKPENVLLRRDVGNAYQVKLCDFGTARQLIDIEKSNAVGDLLRFKRYDEEDGCLTDYVGSRWYRAPELLGFGREYSDRVDIWAIGCIVVEMITGDAVFQGSNEEAILQAVVDFNGNPPNRVISSLISRGMTWNSPSSQYNFHGHARLLQIFERLMKNETARLLADVTAWMLEFDCNCRCSAAAALNHDFFINATSHNASAGEKSESDLHDRAWAAYRSHMMDDIQLKHASLSQLLLFLRSIVSKHIFPWLDEHSERHGIRVNADNYESLVVASQLVISFQCLCLTKFLLEHNIYSDSTPSHVHKILSLYFRQNQDLMTGVERVQHYGSLAVVGLQICLQNVRKSLIYDRLVQSRSLLNVGVVTLFHLLSGALRAQSPVGSDRTVLFDDLADYKCIPITTACHEVFPSLSKILMIILGPHDDIETLRARQAVGIRLTVRRDSLFGDYSSAFSRLFPLLPQIRHCEKQTEESTMGVGEKHNRIVDEVTAATSEGLTIFLLEPAFRSSFSNSDRLDAAGVSIEEGEGIGLQKEFFDGISRDMSSNWKFCQDSSMSLHGSLKFEVENGTNKGSISKISSDYHGIGLKELLRPGRRLVANFDLVNGQNTVDVVIASVDDCLPSADVVHLHFEKIVSEFRLERRSIDCHLSAIYEPSNHQLLVVRRSIGEASSNSFWINSNLDENDENKSHFRALGGCIAMALSSGARLHLQCCSLFYELLLDSEVDLNTVVKRCKDVDSDIRVMDEKGIAGEYVIQVMLGGSSRWPFKAMHEGFIAAFADDKLTSKYGLTGTDIFYALGENESEQADVDWRSVFHIRYDEELQQCEPLRTSLWAAINLMSSKERSQLLKFITGFHSLPSPLTEHLNIEIMEQYNDLGNINRLPQAHTCDNVLQIPNYYNILSKTSDASPLFLANTIKEKLLTSAQQGGGIYGLDRPRNQRSLETDDDVMGVDDDMNDPIEDIATIDDYLAAEEKYDEEEYEHNFEDND